MKGTAIITLTAAAIALAAAVSCSRTLDPVYPCNPGDEIHFAASRTATAQGTKAAYDGTNDLQINWQDDDQIRIVCAQCSETQDALYKAVNAVTSGTGIGQAGLQLVSPAIGLRWGGSTTDHKFYAAYPGSNSINSGTLSASVAASQGGGTISKDASDNWTVAPAMSNMALVSKMTTKPTTNALTFDFTPLTTAIELTITNKRGADMDVKSIALEATAADMYLSGTFEADLDGTWASPAGPTNSWLTSGKTYTYDKTYPVCENLTNSSDKVTIPTPGEDEDYITVAKDKTLTATFFIQPTTHVYNLKFKITFSDDSILTTIIKRVDQATEEANRITFPRHPKSYVTGIFVPEGAQWSVKLDNSGSLTSWEDNTEEDLTLGGEVS